MTTDPRHVVRDWFNRHHRGVAPLPLTNWSADAKQPHVLVECDDGAIGWAVSKTLERSGYAVETCTGPSMTASCALIDSGRCELQSGADVIVNCMNGPARDELVQRTVDSHPVCPVIVDMTPARVADHGAPTGVSVVISPWSGAELVAVVDEAVHRRASTSTTTTT